MTTAPKNFLLSIEDKVAIVRLDRPERKNPLTFDSYAELRDWFRTLPYTDEIQAVVIAPNGGNFSSGGDVHEIIGPLTKMDMKELLAFTRMTGDLIKAMINCGKPIISAVRYLRRGWRDHFDGVRLAYRQPGRQDSLLIQPCWFGWLRYGRLRDTPAHNWPGSRCRIALFWAFDERRRRSRLGLF